MKMGGAPCAMRDLLIAPVFVQDRLSIDQSLTSLFDAERTVRRLHDELARQPEAALLATLTDAIAAALKESDEDEAGLRLVRISSLLGELEGQGVVDALIDVLTSENPEARSHAGEVLEGLAFDRFKEVARGVERALKRLPVGSPALPELPYILVEIPEPGVIKLLGQFLRHGDADAVAAAIEALVQVGDPSAARMIEPLVDDMRTVELDEDGSENSTELTLGELAEEALEILAGGGDDGEDEPANGQGLPS
jgi:HEAT repeat protein